MSRMVPASDNGSNVQPRWIGVSRFAVIVDLTGFEPATFTVQGCCSPVELKAHVNLLYVDPTRQMRCRSLASRLLAIRDSNPTPPVYQTDALTN